MSRNRGTIRDAGEAVVAEAWNHRVAGGAPPLAVGQELFEALLTGLDGRSGWEAAVSEPAYAFGILRAEQGRDVTGVVGDILALRLLLWGHVAARPESDGDVAQLLLLHERLCEMLDVALRCAVDAYVDESTRVLASMATRDSLTGLLNRSGFAQALGAELEGASDQAPLAVAALDLDGFKAVNDTLGHLAGDDVLQAVATLLLDVLPPSGSAARLGGDEFAILLPGMGSGAVSDAVGRVLEATHDHPLLARPEAPVRLSIGIALATGWLPAPEALAVADEAMYAAKRAGGDRWALARAPHRPSSAGRKPVSADSGAVFYRPR